MSRIVLLNPLAEDLVDPNLLPSLPFGVHEDLGTLTATSRCANASSSCARSTSCGASAPPATAPATTATASSTPRWVVPAWSCGASSCWPYSSRASIAISTARRSWRTSTSTCAACWASFGHVLRLAGLLSHLGAQCQPAHAGLAGGGESARGAFRIGNPRQSDPPVPQPIPRIRLAHPGQCAANRRLTLPTTLLGAHSLHRNR